MVSLTKKISNLKVVIILTFSFFILSSCKKEESLGVECYYRKEEGFHNFIFYYDSLYRTFYATNMNYLIKDSLERYITYPPISKSKDTLYSVKLKKVENIYDTLFFANSVGDKAYTFNGIFSGRKWEIGLYYPYSLEGSYSFTISEEEETLLNYAIQEFEERMPLADLDFKADSNIAASPSLFFLRMKNKEKSKDFFTITRKGCSQEMSLLNQVILTIARSNINPANKTSGDISCLQVRDMYNNLGDSLLGGVRVPRLLKQDLCQPPPPPQ